MEDDNTTKPAETIDSPPASKEITPDPAVRFRGLGTNFRAKLIGIDDIPDSRGDKMCQESIIKLKAAVLASGRHKQRVVINVSLEGIKIVDITTGEVQHVHPVHRISFIARDLTDRRAFGYVYGAGEGKHQFFGIKTAKVAEVLVLALRDLFQVVYDMKKKEIEDAKTHQNGEEVQEHVPAPQQQQQVNQAPIQQQQQGGGEGNLFALEQQLTTIQEGINNIDSIGPWPQDLPTSPDTPGFGDGSGSDLFGIASNGSSGQPKQTSNYSDELFDLASPVAQPAPQPGAKLTKEQILSSFGGAPQPQGMFPGQPGMMAAPGMMAPPGQMPMQYGQQQFMPQQQMPRYQQPVTPVMGVFPPGPSPAIPPRPGAMRPAVPSSLAGGAAQNPFGDASGDMSGGGGMLAPMSNNAGAQSGSDGAATKSDPFAGLVSGIGGTEATTKKDMFKNFQMAKPPQPPPRTNPPVSGTNEAAKPASDFDNYFLNSVGGLPLTDDVTNNNPSQATKVASAPANDPFAMGLVAQPAATTAGGTDPFQGNQAFSQAFEFNQGSNSQSLFG